MTAPASGIPQAEVFARNVTDYDGLGYVLMEAARAELGPAASRAETDARASRLLLQALLSVGIDPKTELLQRERLTSLLRGDPLPDSEVQKAAEYLLSQMVVQPKGTLAECLAIPGCIEYMECRKSAGLLPANTGLRRGGWARRLAGCERTGDYGFGEWREAADMIFYAFPEEAMDLKLGEVSSGRPQPQGDALLVFGAAEVKCYSGISRKRLDEQLERHLLRLGGGLQFRDPPGRTIEREYAPSQVWYAVPDGETLHVVCAEDRPLRAVRRPDGSRTFNVVWVDAGLRSLIRLTIGPRPSASTAAHRSPKVFDSVLPYDEGQLEEIGSAMAYYTLGAMADQPDVDLSGPEWSSNLERALECASTGLSRRQLARRERILSRLR